MIQYNEEDILKRLNRYHSGGKVKIKVKPPSVKQTYAEIEAEKGSVLDTAKRLNDLEGIK